MQAARFKDFIAAKAKAGGCCNVVWFNLTSVMPGHFPPLLRGVVFLGQAHFGANDHGDSFPLLTAECAKHIGACGNVERTLLTGE